MEIEKNRFIQKQSIVKRLVLTVVLTAFFFLLESAAVYVSSLSFLKGLTELQQTNKKNELIRQSREIGVSLKTLVEQNFADLNKQDSSRVFKATHKRGLELVQQSLESEKKDPQVNALLKKTELALKEVDHLTEALFGGSQAQKDMNLLLVNQYLLEVIENLSQAQILLTNESNKIFDRVYETRFTPIAISLVIALILFTTILYLGINVFRRIQNSIYNLLHATKNVSQGNLAFEAPIIHADEIGSLTHSFNQMIRTIADTTVSRNYVESIVQSISDCVIVFDSQGIIKRANKVTSDLFEYPEAELIGKNISLLIGDNAPLSESSKNVETEAVTKNGEVVPIELSISPLKGHPENELHYVCLIEDITDRKIAEQEIKNQNIALMNANRELEAFSYSVSHDLRSPLRAIDGFGMALHEDYSDKLNEEGRQHIRRIREATQTMARLIDDLLNLSRLTRTHMKIESVNLSQIVQEITTDLIQKEPERNVSFKIENNLHAPADASLIRIALENLLNNAWKYTSKHPTARIEFGITTYKGEDWFFVKDDGAGFDMAYAKNLFGAFQRLHGKNEFSGTGIGLATVQRIIHRHGGSIEANAELEKGATFYFKLY